MGDRLPVLVTRRILSLALAAFCLAACGGPDAAGEPQPPAPPRLPLESVLGTYTGSMVTAKGIEAVVLQIHDVAPVEDGYTFRYTLNVREQMEEGLGILRAGETTTRVCFDENVCGWLLSEEGSVRIAAGSGEPDAPWSLERL